MKFVLFRRLTLRGYRWYWHLKANNGKVVAQSEGYRNRHDAADTIETIRAKAGSAVVELAS